METYFRIRRDKSSSYSKHIDRPYFTAYSLYYGNYDCMNKQIVDILKSFRKNAATASYIIYKIYIFQLT